GCDLLCMMKRPDLDDSIHDWSRPFGAPRPFRDFVMNREENGLKVPGSCSTSSGSAAVFSAVKSWLRRSWPSTIDAVNNTTLRPGRTPGPPLKGTSGQSFSLRSSNHSSGAKRWASARVSSSRWKNGAKIKIDVHLSNVPLRHWVSSVVSRKINGV